MAGEQYGEQGNETEGSALRKERDRLAEEVKALKSERRERNFKDAGLDPERGIGKAVAKLYEGEDDPEAIQQFAKDEFDWEPPAPENQGDGAGELSDEERARSEGEQRLSSVASNSLPPRSPSLNDDLKEAERKGKETGDWSEFDRLAVEFRKQQAS